jgi:hypothetical protein
LELNIFALLLDGTPLHHIEVILGVQYFKGMAHGRCNSSDLHPTAQEWVASTEREVKAERVGDQESSLLQTNQQQQKEQKRWSEPQLRQLRMVG